MAKPIIISQTPIKVKAVLKLHRPPNKKESRSFIGMDNYYKSLWSQCAHILAPLGDCNGNKPFSLEDTKEKAFNAMKTLMTSECINKCPDYTNFFISIQMLPIISLVLLLSRMEALLRTGVRNS